MRASRRRSVVVCLLAGIASGCAATRASVERVFEHLQRNEIAFLHRGGEIQTTVLTEDARLSLVDTNGARIPRTVPPPIGRTPAVGEIDFAPLALGTGHQRERRRPAEVIGSAPGSLPRRLSAAGDSWAFEEPGNGEWPLAPIAHTGLASCADQFLWTLGTGIGDEERGARWTSAALALPDDPTVAVPTMRTWGSTCRAPDYWQVAPGFFWKPVSQLVMSVSLPLGLSPEAPDWGVVVSLSR